LFLFVGDEEKKVFIIFSTEIFVEQNWSKIKDFFGKKLFQSFNYPPPPSIEIGLEQAPFFSSFEHVKSLLIMGPNNTKNPSLKSEFLIITNE
jgi:hypothetical protein